ncbi:cupin domain-containing protein [Flindersiella endophytica]
MRIIELAPDTARSITNHGSRGLRANNLIRGEHVAATVLHLAAGGEAGRHPAVGDQLFIVISGHGHVCGGDEIWQPIAAGQAAFWVAGELHTTRADEPLTAVAIEMHGLPLAL